MDNNFHAFNARRRRENIITEKSGRRGVRGRKWTHNDETTSSTQSRSDARLNMPAHTSVKRSGGGHRFEEDGCNSGSSRASLKRKSSTVKAGPRRRVQQPHSKSFPSCNATPICTAEVGSSSGPQCSLPTSLDNDISHFRRGFTIWKFGKPTSRCTHCGAVVWYEERINKFRSSNNPTFSICCQDGKVQLPYFQKCPQYLDELLNYNGGVVSRQFRDNIRTYNTMFAFTSMGGHIDRTVNEGRGPYIFRINGQNHHKIGSLLPTFGAAKFAQLYIYDTENEVTNRINAPGLPTKNKVDDVIVSNLIAMFDRSNELAKVFRMGRDRFEETSMQPVVIRLVDWRSKDARQYNLPSSSELAGLIVSNSGEHKGYRDIILEERSGLLRRINEAHPSFMALQYPILFPYAEDGYRCDIKYRGTDVTRVTKRVYITMREYYAYVLQFRVGDGNTLLRGGRLLQQYIVDAYTCIEEDRLRWVRHNQRRIRAELYKGLKDAVTAGDTSAICVGKRMVLPSSFTGGPRYMVQNYQDAMAICRWAGSPDFFITFTCNPKWIEIEEMLALFPGQRVEGRPDVVARVFHIKLNELMTDIKSKGHFGKMKAGIAHVYYFKTHSTDGK